MKTIIETVYLQDMLTSGILGITYKPKEGTTLNSYLDIPPVTTTGVPKIGYYTVGISSKSMDSQIEGIEHSPLDITLFEQIPLKMKNIAEGGFSNAEIAVYGLIKEKVVNGITYLAAYAKRIDSVPTATSMKEVILKDDGLYDISPFKFKDGSLGKPVPKKPKDYVFLDTTPSVAVSASLQISFSLQDVVDIKNSIKVLYGEENINYILDKVTELGIVASNASDGYYQHTHYIKINRLLNALTLESNKVFDLDIGAMAPINI